MSLGALFSDGGAEVFMEVVKGGGVELFVLVLLLEVSMIGGAMLGIRRDDGVSFDALFLEEETEAFLGVRWARDVGFGSG